MTSKKLGKIALMITTVSFLWFGTFGLINHMSEMAQDGGMGGCILNGQISQCMMSIPEHIALWQGLVTSLPQSGFLSILALLLVSVSLIAFWQNHLYKFYERIAFRYKLYIKQYSQINIFNYLQESFSGGILNSKIYEPAII